MIYLQLEECRTKPQCVRGSGDYVIHCRCLELLDEALTKMLLDEALAELTRRQ